MAGTNIRGSVYTPKVVLGIRFLHFSCVGFENLFFDVVLRDIFQLNFYTGVFLVACH